MRRNTLPLTIAIAAALAAFGGTAAAPGATPPEAAVPAAEAQGPAFAPGEIVARFRGGPEKVIHLPQGVGVEDAALALGENERIAYATPNFLAHAAGSGSGAGAQTATGFIPNDPGTAGTNGGWQATQWNLLPCGSLCAPGTAPLPFESRGGIDAPRAWATMRALGKAGGAGVKVAILDTGVAYRALKPKFSKSPDFQTRQFTPGFDFVDGDAVPIDEDGHGTHVAGTVAEQTGNGRSLTGIAYGAKLMPIRVLDASGEGKARDIGQGLVYAAKHGARVINMSFEFGTSVKSCKEVRSVCRGIRFANSRGVLVVAAAGNDFDPAATYPARIPGVVGVGAATEGGCIAGYSNVGPDVELFAPGGQGESGTLCQTADRPIFQLTFMGNDTHRFGLPTVYAGTSMAAAHVSGLAAMILASGELGAKPAPARVQCQLTLSARTTNLGEPYDPARWGAGLIDAGKAVAGALC